MISKLSPNSTNLPAFSNTKRNAIVIFPANALAAAIRRLAVRTGARAWSAPVPQAAVRLLDRDLDTPAVLRLLQTLTRVGEPAAVAVARHLGLRLAG